jgi:hypothetical protein
MEYRGNLEFCIGTLNKELKRLETLAKLINDEHRVNKVIQAKINSVKSALNTLNNTNKKEYDPKYAITYVRANLNWLKQQVNALPYQQKIIDEIELVTDLLLRDSIRN